MSRDAGQAEDQGHAQGLERPRPGNLPVGPARESRGVSGPRPLVPGEGFPFTGGIFSVLGGRRARQLSGGPFLKALMAFVRLNFVASSPPRGPPSYHRPTGLRVLA